MLATDQDLLQMYRWMVLTRIFDQRVCDLHGRPELVEMQHASIGQEAVTVGTVYGLRPDDPILPSLRGRGAFLVRGIPPRVQMAGMYGKITGAGGGRCTSHHQGDPARHILLGSAIIGAGIPVSVGAALAIKLERSDRVSVSFFGDGAAQRGDFHEGLNMAGAFKLPVVFVLENNGYASYTPVSRHMAGENFAVRARGYGFPGVIVDGCDVIAVYEVVQEAVRRARAGDGPTLIEAITHRWRSHCERDKPDAYRVPGEMETFEAKDPIRRLAVLLRGRGVLTPELERRISEEAVAEMDEAVAFAERSPFPAPEEVANHVYAPADFEYVPAREA